MQLSKPSTVSSRAAGALKKLVACGLHLAARGDSAPSREWQAYAYPICGTCFEISLYSSINKACTIVLKWHKSVQVDGDDMLTAKTCTRSWELRRSLGVLACPQTHFEARVRFPCCRAYIQLRTCDRNGGSERTRLSPNWSAVICALGTALRKHYSPSSGRLSSVERNVIERVARVLLRTHGTLL